MPYASIVWMLLFAVASLAQPPASAAADAGDAWWYISARTGAQCTLQPGAEAALEHGRIAALAPSEVWVSSVLAPDRIPEECIPHDPAFYATRPWAYSGLAPGTMACAACGCPETWHYCMRSAAPAAAMKAAGYAPVRAGADTDGVGYLDYTERIGCSADGNTFVIATEREYEAAFAGRCGDRPLPDLDFQHYTLLGYPGMEGGCRVEFIPRIHKDPAAMAYVYELGAVVYGTCKMLNMRENWVLVPRLPEGYTVEFRRKEPTRWEGP